MAHSFKGEMFEKFPVPNIGWNTFTLDTQNNFTTDWGRITPIFCEPNLPGETWKMAIAMFVRMMPLSVPIMHQVDCFVHAFHVRNPILWRNWRDFIRGGNDGRTNILPPCVFKDISKTYAISLIDEFNRQTQIPNSYRSCITEGSLMDYLGYPIVSSAIIRNIDQEMGNDLNEMIGDIQPFDILPFKAYQSIWNEYYMDEYVDEDLKVDLLEDFDGDYSALCYGDNQQLDPRQLVDLFKLRYRRWEKDAFTSALQKPIAVPEVLIPMSADINIYSKDDDTPVGFQKNYFTLLNKSETVETSTQLETPNLVDLGGQFPSDFNPYVYASNGYNQVIPQFDSIASRLRGEIASVSATINQLRANVAVQEWYELSARAGNRYKEMLIAHFNTVVPDYTLDRPQYLGGTRFTIGISQVLQTSATQGQQGNADFQPLGQMAGQGLSGTGDFLFKEKFYEHGWVMLLFSIRPRSMYVDYMPKKYQKFDRREYYWNKLANIGDQEVFNREVFCKQFIQLTDNGQEIANYDPNGTFGYQTRFWEYKYIPNSVHGDFRTTLKDWHLGRFFDEQPLLNSDFLEVSGNQLNRVFAYTGDDYDHFVCQANIDCKVTRPIPIYSIPKFS